MAGSGRHNADERIIAALAGGATHGDAAKAAGVATRTVERRLTNPVFRAQVQQARGEMVENAVGILARASTAAAVTLARLLRAESESVQLSAARSILELGSKLREQRDIEERLAALEAAETLRSDGEVARWRA